MSTCSCVIDTTGTILSANQDSLDLLGYATDEFVGKNFRDFQSSNRFDTALDCLNQQEHLMGFPIEVKGKEHTQYIVCEIIGHFEEGALKSVEYLGMNVEQSIYLMIEESSSFTH